MKKICAIFLFFILFFNVCFSQNERGTITGTIIFKKQGIPFANITVKETNQVVTTDENGNYAIETDAGKLVLIVEAIGYKTQEKIVVCIANQKTHYDFYLEESIFNLNQIVVTSSRTVEKKQEAPVMVTITSNEVLQKTQALSLAEGLNFQPGLRMENNCQNCGFSQVRINGLDGAYSQILIDNRPIFSALNGVYGLDQIPANMIDRIEVVRGGGSSLYGSNAIAGTINIITKDPVKNAFEVSNYLGLLEGREQDKALTLNGTLLSDDLKLGFQVFGMLRNRDAFDANADNFTEITAMENKTFGFKTFYRPTERQKITVDFNSIYEKRRGGENNFNLRPFEALITEEITSRVTGIGLTYEHFSEDKNSSFAHYFNFQDSKNDNFYGGRVNNEFTGEIDLVESLKGYGNTAVSTYVIGSQFNKKQERFLGGSATLTAGAEYRNEKMLDEKPGFNAFVNQRLSILGIYAQQDWKVNEKLKLSGGLRADFHNAANENVILNPRFTALYNIKENLQWRTSYAKGFRAPQVFSEDIHARIAAGEVALVILANDLVSETSHSFLTSLDWNYNSQNTEAGVTLEGFFTRLNNPFILEQITETFWEKRNGDGANVYGINVDLKFAPNIKWQFQGGATLQKALYNEAVQWSENNINTNRNFFRSPNIYGNIMATYAPKKAFQNNLTGVYTGSMYVPHFAGFISDDTLRKTDAFFELNWKSAYVFNIKNNFQLEISGGIQNIFNSYQRDFDRGVLRDAGYIYGPGRPRTFFIGLKIGNDLL